MTQRQHTPNFGWLSNRPVAPRHRRWLRFAPLLLLGLLLLGSLQVAAAAPVGVTRISLGNAGAEANNFSREASISADGRFVAFESFASNLVVGDTNGHSDIFVFDRFSGMTERVSVTSDGAEANLSSYTPSISGNGRYIAFASDANNLVSGDNNGILDIFVHDRLTGVTERVSIAQDGSEGDKLSRDPQISLDGEFVVFETPSALVSDDTNAKTDIYLYERSSRDVARVSISSAGVEADNSSRDAELSADALLVVFASQATNLVANDTNQWEDIFVHNLSTGTTERVSVATDGSQSNRSSFEPRISADGRTVTFTSQATNLVAGDTNQVADIFVHDRSTGTTDRVSVDSNGAQLNGLSSRSSVSADGRFIAFQSLASNLVAGDTNGVFDIFVSDRVTGDVSPVTVGLNGANPNAHSFGPSMSHNGHQIAFFSYASNLVAGDTNDRRDIFIADMFGVDSDGDGLIDLYDSDDDNDTVLDIHDDFPLDPTEWLDTDGDGTGNNADTDDDNDTVLDIHDDFPLDPTEWLDTDGDGTGNNADTDDDNDTVLDIHDDFPLDPTEWLDTDGDGVGNNADSDDDNDTVLDIHDDFPFDPTEWLDTDADGIGNNADADDDNDTVLDIHDDFPLDPTEWLDSDGDGIGDNADSDDDNDTVLDIYDDLPLDPTEWLDTDGDGVGNNADSDDDNDTVLDIYDDFPLDPTEWLDTDADGTGNNADSDDDNDGFSDTNDAFPLDPTEWFDTDGDGIGNNADSDDDNDTVLDIHDDFPLDPTEWLDTDGDGIGDNADSDDDNDGFADSNDAFPFDPTEWLDTDGDGIGNNADTDDDNDGVDDALDAFPLDPTEWADNDGDGIGDNADPDDDNDGQSDLIEKACGSNPLNAASLAPDFDGDGALDCLDDDDDNDGVLDVDDAFPFDPTESADNDNDGVGNNADTDDDNDGQLDDDEITCGSDPFDANSLSPDFDNDFVPDCLDTDLAVTSFTLIDADTDQPIPGFETMIDGMELDLSALPTHNLNIRANVNGAPGSVYFDLTDRLEEEYPFAMAGDNPTGDYHAWTPAPGSYSVTATPFEGEQGDGAVGVAYTLSFTVTAGPPTEVVSYTLINADTNQPIAGYENITGDITLVLSDLPTERLNIRANVNGAAGSVTFTLDGEVVSVENVAPYALFGDRRGNYKSMPIIAGTYVLEATPHSNRNGNGDVGIALTITLTIED